MDPNPVVVRVKVQAPQVSGIFKSSMKAEDSSNIQMADDGKLSPSIIKDGERLSLSHLRDENPEWIMAYSKVTVLSIDESPIKDLKFLLGLPNLTEIYADKNQIESIVNCRELPNLNTLSLCHNWIDKIDETIAACQSSFPKLAHISLLGNPCCPSPITGGTYDLYLAYCRRVFVNLPGLKFIDSIATHTIDIPEDKQVSKPLISAVENIMTGDIKGAVDNLATTWHATTELSTEVTSNVIQDLLTNTKFLLRQPQSEDDRLKSLQHAFLPTNRLEHDGELHHQLLISKKKKGKITEREYQHFVKMNASLQQEFDEINRSDTVIALEHYEDTFFPECYRKRVDSANSTDTFSKEMMSNGLKHKDIHDQVKQLRHTDLPQSLDLSDLSIVYPGSDWDSNIDSPDDK